MDVAQLRIWKAIAAGYLAFHSGCGGSALPIARRVPRTNAIDATPCEVDLANLRVILPGRVVHAFVNVIGYDDQDPPELEEIEGHVREAAISPARARALGAEGRVSSTPYWVFTNESRPPCRMTAGPYYVRADGLLQSVTLALEGECEIDSLTFALQQDTPPTNCRMSLTRSTDTLHHERSLPEELASLERGPITSAQCPDDEWCGYHWRRRETRIRDFGSILSYEVAAVSAPDYDPCTCDECGSGVIYSAIFIRGPDGRSQAPYSEVGDSGHVVSFRDATAVRFIGLADIRGTQQVWIWRLPLPADLEEHEPFTLRWHEEYSDGVIADRPFDWAHCDP